MVNQFAKEFLASDCFPIDQPQTTANIYYQNTFDLMKLRQKYDATGVSMLPNGVFRCILEYQFPAF